MSSSASLMSNNNNNNIDIVSWNVRGLNTTARCLAVHQTIANNPCQIAYLQETKLSSIDSALASFLDAYRLTSFSFKPVSGTRGASFFFGTIQWQTSPTSAADDTLSLPMSRYDTT
jgi:hypothetical protein